MARINTNVSSLVAQRVLGNNNKSLGTSLERLSTGLKINTGKDDPAGLIASENLRSEKTGITAALENAERAGNVIGIAEGGLSEVSSLLNEVQGLVNDSANTGGLSQEEIDANQLQVDSILNTINRLAQSTSFQGQKLLNGAKDYTVDGATASNFQNLRVNRAKLLDGADLTVGVTVTSAATQAKLSGAVAAIGSTAATTIRISGKDGAEEITFAAGTSASNVAAAINERTAATGVKASGTDILSTGFGSDEFATVEVVQGTFAGAGTDAGSDANVSVNGSKAETKGDSVIYRSAGLDIEFDLGAASNVNGATADFTVTGGGANFALGSKVTEGNKESIGIAAVDTGNLGLQGSRLSTPRQRPGQQPEQRQHRHRPEDPRRGDQAGQPDPRPARGVPEVHESARP